MHMLGVDKGGLALELLAGVGMCSTSFSALMKARPESSAQRPGERPAAAGRDPRGGQRAAGRALTVFDDF